MPRGPQGQKTPADLTGCAIMVAKIAAGEIEEPRPLSGRALSRKAGTAARAQKFSTEERRETAKKAASAKWQK